MKPQVEGKCTFNDIPVKSSACESLNSKNKKKLKSFYAVSAIYKSKWL